jgi:tRNA/tmRNA/rRNA uracil-C5-methylase (TrmA/RlmC/RlmD family)
VAVGALLEGLGSHGRRIEAVIVGENISGTERVLHLETQPNTPFDAAMVEAVVPPQVTGISTWVNGRPMKLSGSERITDRARDLFTDVEELPIPRDTTWTRTAASFFQGNRFLVGALVDHVLQATRGQVVADLYAGVGLFAVALAATGRRVLAIEGDRTSAADLAVNAQPYQTLEAHRSAVEHAARRLRRGAFDTVVLDPPRAGLSREALESVVALRAPRIIYVSCDPATLARDAGRLVTSGYELETIQGFDLFPATGHVEVVAVFAGREGP